MGNMLVAGDESEAPEVTYPLERSGWYEISVGVYRKPFEEPKEVQVRLSDDSAFTTLAGRFGEKDHQENYIDDVYWKTANLSGRRIVLRQIVIPEVRQAWIAYIKLVPLSPAEIRALEQDRSRADTKRLFVHTDAHFPNVTGSALELRNHIEPLRDTDVARIYWEAGAGDTAHYFSKIAQAGAGTRSETEDLSEAFFPRKIDREWAETWAAYRRNDVDPLRIAAEFARECGLEIHASYRAGGFHYMPPHDIRRGSFYARHPELRCVSRGGQPVPRISYAFPETRRYVVSLFREMAQYPIDGVCVLYNRRPPLVAYEPPLVDGFRGRYGEDPRKLGESDSRWLEYRCVALTAFMRELRQALDEEAEKQGREQRFEISAVVSRHEENLQHGMDLAAWIRDDLVDTLIPYSSSIRLHSSVPSWESVDDFAPFLELVRDTQCQLALNLMPRDIAAEEYRRKAHFMYDAGVTNFFFWDGISRVRKALRLGHRNEVEAWVNAGEPALVPDATRLTRLAGWDLGWETPG